MILLKNIDIPLEDKACLAASEAVRILAEWDKSGEIALKMKMPRG